MLLVWILSVADEVFGFVKFFLRTALIFGLILILQDLYNLSSSPFFYTFYLILSYLYLPWNNFQPEGQRLKWRW